MSLMGACRCNYPQAAFLWCVRCRSHDRLFPSGSQEYNQESLALATAYIDRMDADMGQWLSSAVA